MKSHLMLLHLITLFLLLTFARAQNADTGLAPEVTDLNAEDISFAREKDLPYLEKPFINPAPAQRKDALPVGKLDPTSKRGKAILAFANKLAAPPKDTKAGNTDSFLIAHQGKLIFESYFRRGRINYPHYQMSITKSYTAMAIGRAIQLGHLTHDDLHKPAISFLKNLDQTKLVKGAEKITLHEAMQMRSGIRLNPKSIAKLRANPTQLTGQGQIQAYLQHSSPIPPAPREFKYQGADTALTMQVLEASVPGTAKDFLRKELWAPLGVTNYQWQDDTSGLPKAAAGSSIRSRDMIKMGILTINKGQWNGQQLIPADFIKTALSPLVATYNDSAYGYFWWTKNATINGKTWLCHQGRGAGGQFIFLFPELDLVAVITSHNKGMGTKLHDIPQLLIPLFKEQK